MIDLGTLPGCPGRALATQGDPKNSKKVDVLLKKGVPNAICCRLVRITAVFRAFCMIFHRFFTKKTQNTHEKNDVFVHFAACFFQHGDPDKTLYFTMRKLLFHFLSFCFFSKKMSKIECKIGPRKKSKKMTQLGPKMIPKLIKSRFENLENH